MTVVITVVLKLGKMPILQAGIFARHVMGVEHPTPNPAWFWTDQLNINYQFVGDMAAAEWIGHVVKSMHRISCRIIICFVWCD